MASTSITLNATYINNTLIPNLNAVTLQTELGGNASKVLSFSFAGGNSTYSFGLYQYDVGAAANKPNIGNNAAILNFLTTAGFTSTQIAQLSQNGGLPKSTVDALSAQLGTALQNPANQAALQQLNATWANGLVSQLQTALNVIEQNNPDIANQIYQSPELQLRLLDYANQFGLLSGSTGKMVNWLSGQITTIAGGLFHLTPGHKLSGNDINQFVINTQQGVNYYISQNNRLTALDLVISTLSQVNSSLDLSGSSSIPLAFTNATINLANSSQAVVTGNGNAFILASGANLTCTGSGESIAASAAYDNITLGNNSSANITGNSDSVNFGTGDTATVTGTNDLLYFVNVSGKFSINGSAGLTTVNGAGDAVRLNGTGGQVVMYGGYNTVDISGSGVSVDAFGDQLNLANNTSGTFAGNNDTIKGGTGDTANLTGDKNYLILGTGGTANVTGSWNTVNATGSTVNINTDYSGAVLGNGNIINATASGTSYYGKDFFSVSGNNNIVNASNVGLPLSFGISGTGEAFNGSNSNVTLANNSSGIFTGGKDFFAVGKGGTATAIGNGNAFILASGANLTCTGSGESIAA
ncbi:MAG: hypothetical protein K2P57_13400, partial [Burkholderiales bacterium]|nr:hypothetical protein [Burkholderiales bacterium]